MQPVPEGYKPLGFAGFTDKGGYSESEVYAENDLVHFGAPYGDVLLITQQMWNRKRVARYGKSSSN